jgi:hypothetical protein
MCRLKGRRFASGSLEPYAPILEYFTISQPTGTMVKVIATAEADLTPARAASTGSDQTRRVLGRTRSSNIGQYIISIQRECECETANGVDLAQREQNFPEAVDIQNPFERPSTHAVVRDSRKMCALTFANRTDNFRPVEFYAS